MTHKKQEGISQNFNATHSSCANQLPESPISRQTYTAVLKESKCGSKNTCKYEAIFKYIMIMATFRKFRQDCGYAGKCG